MQKDYSSVRCMGACYTIKSTSQWRKLLFWAFCLLGEEHAERELLGIQEMREGKGQHHGRLSRSVREQRARRKRREERRPGMLGCGRDPVQRDRPGDLRSEAHDLYRMRLQAEGSGRNHLQVQGSISLRPDLPAVFFYAL
jgi:hypothetical protein